MVGDLRQVEAVCVLDRLRRGVPHAGAVLVQRLIRHRPQRQKREGALFHVVLEQGGRDLHPNMHVTEAAMHADPCMMLSTPTRAASVEKVPCMQVKCDQRHCICPLSSTASWSVATHLEPMCSVVNISCGQPGAEAKGLVLRKVAAVVACPAVSLLGWATKLFFLTRLGSTSAALCG